jgi:hypothetical protein
LGLREDAVRRLTSPTSGEQPVTRANVPISPHAISKLWRARQRVHCSVSNPTDASEPKPESQLDPLSADALARGEPEFDRSDSELGRRMAAAAGRTPPEEIFLPPPTVSVEVSRCPVPLMWIAW